MAQQTETVETYDQAGNLIDRRTITWQTTPDQDNEATVGDRASAAMADLRTLRDTTGTLTAAQMSNALRLLARVALALIRLQLRRFDSTE
jgi:hypothetical protein